MLIQPFDQVLQSYLDALRLSSYSPQTLKKYQADLMEFLEWLTQDPGIHRIQDLTREILTTYQNRVMVQRRVRDGLPLSLSMKYSKLAVLKHFLRFLERRRTILYDPASNLDLPRLRKDTLREVLKEKEVRRLLEAAHGNTPLEIRDRAILELFYSTGIRNSEARSLELRDIDFERGELRVRHGKRYFGERERIVPVGKTALLYLEEYLTRGRPKLLSPASMEILFLSKSGKSLRIADPDRIVKKYAQRAGIPKKVRTHILRHSFATHLLRHGADIRHVQEMLGHRCLDSTQVYTKVEISDLKRVHRKTHPREKSG